MKAIATYGVHPMLERLACLWGLPLTDAEKLRLHLWLDEKAKKGEDINTYFLPPTPELVARLLMGALEKFEQGGVPLPDLRQVCINTMEAGVAELLEKFKLGNAKVESMFDDNCMVSALPLYGNEISLLLHDLGRSELTKVEKLEALIVKEDVVGVVGTSGCGKTRTLYELLCRKYGFYFIAVNEGNFGPDDLVYIVDLPLSGKSMDERALITKNYVWTALLARAMLLERCIRLGYTPCEFLLLQVVGKYHFSNRIDVCRRLFVDLRKSLEGVSLEEQDRILHAEISEVWKLLSEANADPIIVLDDSQALFEMQRGMYDSTSATRERRSAFSPVYQALLQPCLDLIPQPHLVLSATELVLYREESNQSSPAAKPFRAYPSFCEFGKWSTVKAMLPYLQSLLRLDLRQMNGNNFLSLHGQEVNWEALESFVGRYRPLTLVIQHFLEQPGKKDLNDALHNVKEMLVKLDVRGSYYRILCRIQVQPKINDVSLIELCRMIHLKTKFVSSRYYCTLKEEVELIHRGLAYLERVDGEELVGDVQEPLVLAALDNYFRNDNSLAHIMNLLNPSSGGFMFEIAAADDLVRFVTSGKLSEQPLISPLGDCIPEVFRQRAKLFSGDTTRLVCTADTITEYLKKDCPSHPMLQCEFLAGPDMVVPTEMEDGRRILILVQFKLLEALDARRLEAGVATTDPNKIFGSPKATKLRHSFQQEVGSKWWRDGCIRIIVVYPAVLKNQSMPAPVFHPACGNVGPQLELYVHAANATQLLSASTVHFANMFKGFRVGEPSQIAQDRELALKFQAEWDKADVSSSKRKRHSSGYYDETGL